MKDYNSKRKINPVSGVGNILDEILREGASKMLQAAIEKEVDDYISRIRSSEKQSSLVYRNGHAPERDILSGIGPIKIKRPRVDDRTLKKLNKDEGFTSKILPRFLRRVPSIDNLLPILYLKGISSGDFPRALRAILGENVKNISSNTIIRLKESWENEYKNWNKRDLSTMKYIYFWVDGIHMSVRGSNEKPCILVVMAADSEGNKELLAINDGFAESKIAWKEILLELRQRGLKSGPKLAIGDGALGFWSALTEVFPETDHQRCWVHKTRNILDKFPKSMRIKIKSTLHDMYMAEDKETALNNYKKFISLYDDKYPKATACLRKSKEQLFTFYDFPAVHWTHIRTTNPIESTFATVRLRTYKTRGCCSRKTMFTMVYKLAMESQKTWHKLKGHGLIQSVLDGAKYIDGVLEEIA